MASTARDLVALLDPGPWAVGAGTRERGALEVHAVARLARADAVLGDVAVAAVRPAQIADVVHAVRARERERERSGGVARPALDEDARVSLQRGRGDVVVGGGV